MQNAWPAEQRHSPADPAGHCPRYSPADPASHSPHHLANATTAPLFSRRGYSIWPSKRNLVKVKAMKNSVALSSLEKIFASSPLSKNSNFKHQISNKVKMVTLQSAKMSLRTKTRCLEENGEKHGSLSLRSALLLDSKILKFENSPNILFGYIWHYYVFEFLTIELEVWTITVLQFFWNSTVRFEISRLGPPHSSSTSSSLAEASNSKVRRGDTSK